MRTALPIGRLRIPTLHGDLRVESRRARHSRRHRQWLRRYPSKLRCRLPEVPGGGRTEHSNGGPWPCEIDPQPCRRAGLSEGGNSFCRIRRTNKTTLEACRFHGYHSL